MDLGRENGEVLEMAVVKRELWQQIKKMQAVLIGAHSTARLTSKDASRR